ncbi:VOC family protein [Rhodanobacter sp. B05]|uniref:VOC family protein n=1 Tax=Rhodanobacter sp. B05 TaxID=1945859 RepID=UPI001C2CC327|nr:VOC family protein [Rhodanobacter sp. B05]
MTSNDSYIPLDWPPVIPRLSVVDPLKCVSFLREVFGAEGIFNTDRPSEMRIGRSLIMVGGIVERQPTSSFLYVYVADTDQAFEKALSLGAKPVEQPGEMPYGDRRAMVEDPWGNRWQIATHRRFQGNT